MDPNALRMGFPVKVLSLPDVKSSDTRRWANNPHLKVSLEYLEIIFNFLAEHDIHMYRISSDLAPYATHPDMPQFHNMVQESKTELAAIGAKARKFDIRLSFHPSQYIILNSPDEKLIEKSVSDLLSQAQMLDLMGMGPECVVVIHVGGKYEDTLESRQRWVKTWQTLPEPVKRRLVLEHDDMRFSASDTLWIHDQTGVPLIFDHQHFWCLNPEKLDLRETLTKMLRTWPKSVQPKIHFSSPRTELREIKSKDPKTRKTTISRIAPVWTGHADFCNPFEFINFMRLAEYLEFDVMLEAKAKDLALIRLRADLIKYAPEIAARFGLSDKDQKWIKTETSSLLKNAETKNSL